LWRRRRGAPACPRHQLGELGAELRAGGQRLRHQLATQLGRQAAGQLQAHRGLALEVEARRQPDAVVAHRQPHALLAARQADLDAAPAPGRERVLERIAHQLGHQQAEGHRHLQRGGHRHHVGSQRDAAPRGADGVAQVAQQVAHVIAQRHGVQVARLVELFVHQRHRVDTRRALVQRVASRPVRQGPPLQAEQALHHLQVVLDPVVDLAQQGLALGQRALDALLLDMPVRHVRTGGVEALHRARVVGVGHQEDLGHPRAAGGDVAQFEVARLAAQHGFEVGLQRGRGGAAGQLLAGAAQDVGLRPAEAQLLLPVDEAVAQVAVEVGDTPRQVVGHGAQKPLAALGVVARTRHLGLGPLALGGVTHQGQAQRLPILRQRGDGHVDVEHAAIGPVGQQRVVTDGCTRGRRTVVQPGRQQLGDWLAQQLVGRLTEHRLARRVDRGDGAIGPAGEDGIGSRIDDGLRAPGAVACGLLGRVAPA